MPYYISPSNQRAMEPSEFTLPPIQTLQPAVAPFPSYPPHSSEVEVLPAPAVTPSWSAPPSTTPSVAPLPLARPFPTPRPIIPTPIMSEHGHQSHPAYSCGDKSRFTSFSLAAHSPAKGPKSRLDLGPCMVHGSVPGLYHEGHWVVK